MGSKPHAHPSFALIGGCKWYALKSVTRCKHGSLSVYCLFPECAPDGEVVTLRPIELAPARGSAECVHCGLECWTYCRPRRRAVAPECFEEHERDHTEWRTRTGGTWTKVER